MLYFVLLSVDSRIYLNLSMKVKYTKSTCNIFGATSKQGTPEEIVLYNVYIILKGFKHGFSVLHNEVASDDVVGFN